MIGVGFETVTETFSNASNPIILTAKSIKSSISSSRRTFQSVSWMCKSKTPVEIAKSFALWRLFWPKNILQ